MHFLVWRLMFILIFSGSWRLHLWWDSTGQSSPLQEKGVWTQWILHLHTGVLYQQDEITPSWCRQYNHHNGYIITSVYMYNHHCVQNIYLFPSYLWRNTVRIVGGAGMIVINHSRSIMARSESLLLFYSESMNYIAVLWRPHPSAIYGMMVAAGIECL